MQRGFVGRAPETLSILITIGLLILGLAYTFLIVWTTASRHRAAGGVREAAKLGRRLGWNSDAASSLPLALVMIAIALGAGAGMLGLAIERGDYIASWPTAPSVVAVLLLTCGMALTVQGLVESSSTRVYSIVLFLGWMVPFFTMVIMMAAFERFRLGLYVGQPFPPVSVAFSAGVDAGDNGHTDGACRAVDAVHAARRGRAGDLREPRASRGGGGPGVRGDGARGAGGCVCVGRRALHLESAGAFR